ncbi:MAG: hypothetical protein ACRDF4_11340, partial [Rhabdochlamydiaceae bacterium]
KEAVDISYGLVPELSVASKAKLLLQGTKNIAAFTNLIYVVKKMKELNEIYSNYPKSPDTFLNWRQQVDRTMEEAKAKFQPNPT